jgi:hypothetical protein
MSRFFRQLVTGFKDPIDYAFDNLNLRERGLYLKLDRLNNLISEIKRSDKTLDDKISLYDRITDMLNEAGYLNSIDNMRSTLRIGLDKGNVEFVLALFRKGASVTTGIQGFPLIVYIIFKTDMSTHDSYTIILEAIELGADINEEHNEMTVLDRINALDGISPPVRQHHERIASFVEPLRALGALTRDEVTARRAEAARAEAEAEAEAAARAEAEAEAEAEAAVKAKAERRSALFTSSTLPSQLTAVKKKEATNINGFPAQYVGKSMSLGNDMFIINGSEVRVNGGLNNSTTTNKVTVRTRRRKHKRKSRRSA